MPTRYSKSTARVSTAARHPSKPNLPTGMAGTRSTIRSVAWRESTASICRVGRRWRRFRHCYRGVAEVSIYIASAEHGKGIGSELMAALVDASEDHGIWSLYSSIFPQNRATLRLHLRHGFREVGIRERIAQQNGRWRDTLILERRSAKVGI